MNADFPVTPILIIALNNGQDKLPYSIDAKAYPSYSHKKSGTNDMYPQYWVSSIGGANQKRSGFFVIEWGRNSQ